MSLYLETGCFLKLLLDEPDSAAVEAALEGETDLMVSTLVQLKAKSVLSAMQRGGELTKRAHAMAVRALDQLLLRPPFRPGGFPTTPANWPSVNWKAASPIVAPWPVCTWRRRQATAYNAS